MECKNNLGQFHREDELSAVERNDGSKVWYKNGQKHRGGDLPAFERPRGGYKAWYINGLRHRDGGLPAECNAHGAGAWWKDGQRHRDGGLPAIERDDGSRWWYVNNKLHRDGGLPAIELKTGNKEWYVKGRRHREGGLPAVEYESGVREWWVCGKELSKTKAQTYLLFCKKMENKNRIRAQKKIYFWWIQICYDLEHKSGCGQRMAQKNLEVFETMMKV